MRELFEQMSQSIASGDSFVLSVIIDSSGSSPRDSGAIMLSGPQGRIWGSVGGALAEHRVIENAGELLAQRCGCSLRRFSLDVSDDGPLRADATGADSVDAVCGGEIAVFSRFIDAALAGLADLIQKGIDCFSEKESSWLIIGISDSSADAAAPPGADDIPSLCLARTRGEICGAIAAVGIQPPDIPALLAEKPKCADQGGRRWFSLPLTQAGFVYVFGGGHVAQELVPLLDRLDFRAVVFDDREEFTRAQLFPNAVKIIRGDFTRIGGSLSLEAGDYAVIATKGHRWDFHAESFALASPARYIGVIGSKKKHAFVEGQLRAAGFTHEQIHAPRVHAPIGIDIGSKTPAELAVSIAAELINVRHQSQPV